MQQVVLYETLETLFIQLNYPFSKSLFPRVVTVSQSKLSVAIICVAPSLLIREGRARVKQTEIMFAHSK